MAFISCGSFVPVFALLSTHFCGTSLQHLNPLCCILMSFRCCAETGGKSLSSSSPDMRGSRHHASKPASPPAVAEILLLVVLVYQMVRHSNCKTDELIHLSCKPHLSTEVDTSWHYTVRFAPRCMCSKGAPRLLLIHGSKEGTCVSLNFVQPLEVGGLLHSGIITALGQALIMFCAAISPNSFRPGQPIS